MVAALRAALHLPKGWASRAALYAGVASGAALNSTQRSKRRAKSPRTIRRPVCCDEAYCAEPSGCMWIMPRLRTQPATIAYCESPANFAGTDTHTCDCNTTLSSKHFTDMGSRGQKPNFTVDEDTDDVPRGGPARPTRIQHEAKLTGQVASLAAVCTEAAALAAADLSTFWANSVRAFALMRSPFLRPPVFASPWRIVMERLSSQDVSVNASTSPVTVVTSAHLKDVHERRLLEVNFFCSMGGSTDMKLECEEHVVFQGCAWCVATKPGPHLEEVISPPVPLTPKEMEESSRRFETLKARPKLLRTIKASDKGAFLVDESASVRVLALSDISTTKEAEAQIAMSRGLKAPPSCTKPPANACGDLGPVLAAAVRAAEEAMNAERDAHTGTFRIMTVEAETLPLSPGAVVQFRAKTTGKNHDCVFVTGWHGSAAVLRLRATGQLHMH
eukprot:gnl/MRDRNA2_/MRDRNA2_71739_c0_seq1.p1 gnl/MRDRNA2_/MRDRNA2_71739_c0~~gnl/MRDRNA2_/MRDRNA2_71739_c0_seq1.p1  ORF type:complete len:445 (+),score=90.03 gnl/MRDRNA2_/MRDRNA2_71739_c0_seq1:56-1390(+)